MDPINLEYTKIALLLFVVGLLSQILRYIKMIWSKVFDMHIALVRKEDPKRFGGEG
jgi:hypothetical protein